MMDALLIQILTGLAVFGLVYVAVRKAAEEGVFATLCTTAVLYVACRFADLQWKASYGFLMESFGMDSGNAIERATVLSASYWMGFVLVLLPAMLYVKLLTRERVPFPSWLEKSGSLCLGAICGILFFAAIFTGFSRFDFFRDHLQTPLRPYRLMLDLVMVF